jgi:hypothetical protein
MIRRPNGPPPCLGAWGQGEQKFGWTQELPPISSKEERLSEEEAVEKRKRTFDGIPYTAGAKRA